MKRFYKVLRFIFSIVGYLVTMLVIWDIIVLKASGINVKNFIKDTFMFGYDYID